MQLAYGLSVRTRKDNERKGYYIFKNKVLIKGVSMILYSKFIKRDFTPFAISVTENRYLSDQFLLLPRVNVTEMTCSLTGDLDGKQSCQTPF
jgi:hypothetical protein